jgi:hypothetical protein
MKKLRIIVLSLFILIFNIKSFSQTFEIKTGINLSTMLSKNDIETFSEEYQMVPRLFLGVTADFPLTKLFSFETGLLFSSKGYKLDTYYSVPSYEGEYFPIYDNRTLNYFEIPLSLKISANFKNLPFIFTLGPYIGVGLNEKYTISVYNWEEGASERKSYSNQMGNESGWKRIDYGLQAGIGMEIQRIVIRLNYSYGLANISQDSSIKSKNRVIGLTLGYKFNYKKTSL